jgi:hypothetical protein
MLIHCTNSNKIEGATKLVIVKEKMMAKKSK